jgi:hypothetical protein
MVVTDGLSKVAVVGCAEEISRHFIAKEYQKNHKNLELGTEILRPIFEPGKGLPTDDGTIYK